MFLLCNVLVGDFLHIFLLGYTASHHEPLGHLGPRSWRSKRPWTLPRAPAGFGRATPGRPRPGGMERDGDSRNQWGSHGETMGKPYILRPEMISKRFFKSTPEPISDAMFFLRSCSFLQRSVELVSHRSGWVRQVEIKANKFRSKNPQLLMPVDPIEVWTNIEQSWMGMDSGTSRLTNCDVLPTPTTKGRIGKTNLNLEKVWRPQTSSLNVYQQTSLNISNTSESLNPHIIIPHIWQLFDHAFFCVSSTLTIRFPLRLVFKCLATRNWDASAWGCWQLMA